MNENENIMQFQPETDALLRETAAFLVEDDKTAEIAIRHINGLRDLRRRISAMFAPIIANWKRGLEETRVKEKEFTEPLRVREDTIESRVEEFMARRRREREEAERRRIAEIKAVNQKIEDDRIAAAAKAENEGRLKEAARILEAPMPKPSFMTVDPAPCQAPKSIAGATTRRTWHWRLTDLALVPAEFKKIVLDEDKVEFVFKRDREALIKADNEGMPKTLIPGIEVYFEDNLVRR